MTKVMRILVTGSSGQIGSYTVDAARAEGHDVVGLDLRPSGWTDIVGDIRDAAVCADAMTDCDAVIHTAAQVSVQTSLEEPNVDATTNVLGTLNLLESARQGSVDRFVNISSAAVYGNPETIPVHEDHPTRPLVPYGVSKLAAEHYVRAYRETHGVSTVTVRPFNVYSARQDPTSPYSGVLSKFAERVRAGEPPIIFGDGSQTRDFIHAIDVASALLTLTNREEFRTINLGTGNSTSITELAQLFIQATGVQGTPVYRQARRGEIQDSVADVLRYHNLGISARIRLNEGISGIISQK